MIIKKLTMHENEGASRLIEKASEKERASHNS
jgi:hypothetical protein